jgi:hypothetical protein
LALLQWESTEGGQWKTGCSGKDCSGWHNPLNTGYLHEAGDGGPQTGESGRPNSKVAEYGTWNLGIRAMAFTLREDKYSPILNVLKRSGGGAALKSAIELVNSNPDPNKRYGTDTSKWTTTPIGKYAYRDYHKSPFLFKG